MSEVLMSRNERKRFSIAIAVLLVSFVAGLGLWLFFYPVISGSLVFWIGGALMAIPSYVAIESYGTFGLSSKWAKSLPSSIRVLFGVVWLLMGLAIMVVVVAYLSSFTVAHGA